MYTLLADLVVVIHLVFIAFALFGGLLVLRWRKVAWVHLPSIAWISFNQFAGWHCPLTNLEKWLRRLGTGAGYNGGFIEHYILPLIGGHVPGFIEVYGGFAVTVVFVGFYAYVFARRPKPSPA
jgi:hypothetical protein